MSRFLPAAAAAVAAMLPTLLPAAPLTLEQALELAAQRSPSIRAARAGASGAAETVRAAGQLPDPMLGIAVDNLPVTGPERLRTTADSMTMKRVGISQEWVSADKRALRQAAAQAQLGRESLQEQVALAQTRQQTALAYLDAYYASESLKLTTLTEHHLHQEFEAAKARLASSVASSEEVLALTSARGVAQDESASVQQAQAAAQVALQRWIGVQPDVLVTPQWPPAPGEQAYVAAHPAVRQARWDVEVAQSDAASTAADRQPNWTWQASYGQRTGLPDMVSIGVNIPLPIAPGERQDRATAAKLALVDKAQALLEDATRMAAAEYRSLSSEAQRLARRLERFRTGVIAPAQQRTQAALAGYRSNQVPVMTLFEARNAEVESLRKQLDLQRELAKVQAQLAFKPLPGGGR